MKNITNKNIRLIVLLIIGFMTGGIVAKAQQANGWTQTVNNLTVPIYWQYNANNNSLTQTNAPVNGNKATADACIAIVQQQGNRAQLGQGIRCCGVFPESDGTERFLLKLLPLNLQGLILQAGNSAVRKTLFNYCICGCALNAAPNGANTARLCQGPPVQNRQRNGKLLNQVQSPTVAETSFTCLSDITYNLFNSVTPYTDQCLFSIPDSVLTPLPAPSLNTFPYIRLEESLIEPGTESQTDSTEE